MAGMVVRERWEADGDTVQLGNEKFEGEKGLYDYLVRVGWAGLSGCLAVTQAG
jgi:hypothetical protein